MKFQLSSFLLGVGLTAGFVKTHARLRPVLVELVALGVHFGRLGRSLLEREREDLEDLWAEVEERVRERLRSERRARPPPRSDAHVGARA